MKIGIVGGGGWLGQAFAKAFLQAGLCEPSGLTLSSRTGRCTVAELSAAGWTSDNQALADTSDLIIVSVRPDHYPAVRFSAPGALVVSLMAGVPVRLIADRSNSGKVVRAMPNAAVSIRKSFTPWVASAEVCPEEKDLVHRIFASCGRSVEIQDEAQIDTFTALTGPGPALPALLADAMIAYATARGIAPELARQAVRSIVADATGLLDDTDPAEIVATFLRYRGTTAAGLDAMIGDGFRQIVASGLDRMVERAADTSAG